MPNKRDKYTIIYSNYNEFVFILLHHKFELKRNDYL